MSARVLHVCDFAAPYPGAFIRQLRMLDDELRARMGVDAPATVFAFPARAEGRQWLRDLRADGFEVHLLPDAGQVPRPSLVRQLRTLIEQTGCDVVHSHFGTYDLGVAAAMWLVRLRRRVPRPVQVWHYRTALEEPVEARGLRRRLKDLVKYRLAGASVDRAVGVTAAMGREAAARGLGSRATAVLAGCDTETFRPDDAARARVRDELGIEPGQTLVLHLGWAWHRKGGDLLAAAARELARRGHDGLVFASVGAPVDELEQPVRALEPTDRIWELHQASDVFVSASRSEGFGNGLVEALACGRVAVAAAADGQVETFAGLGAGCRTVPVGDAISIADAMEQLLAARDSWASFGRANRQHVVERMSMRTWARNMADAYDELRPAPRPRTTAAAAA